jgi:hypothetical protein
MDFPIPLGGQRGLGYLLIEARVDAREVSNRALVGYAVRDVPDHLIINRRNHERRFHEYETFPDNGVDHYEVFSTQLQPVQRSHGQ